MGKGTTLKLEWDKYKHFVSQLFEFDQKEFKLSGITFDGDKRGFPVKIFNFIKYKESGVDNNYISELHKNIGGKRYGRVYIVAPITRVDFIADYEEIDDTKYYFLKVPMVLAINSCMPDSQQLEKSVILRKLKEEK